MIQDDNKERIGYLINTDEDGTPYIRRLDYTIQESGLGDEVESDSSADVEDEESNWTFTLPSQRSIYNIVGGLITVESHESENQSSDDSSSILADAFIPSNEQQFLVRFGESVIEEYPSLPPRVPPRGRRHFETETFSTYSISSSTYTEHPPSSRTTRRIASENSSPRVLYANPDSDPNEIVFHSTPDSVFENLADTSAYASDQYISPVTSLGMNIGDFITLIQSFGCAAKTFREDVINELRALQLYLLDANGCENRDYNRKQRSEHLSFIKLTSNEDLTYAADLCVRHGNKYVRSDDTAWLFSADCEYCQDWAEVLKMEQDQEELRFSTSSNKDEMMRELERLENILQLLNVVEPPIAR